LPVQAYSSMIRGFGWDKKKEPALMVQKFYMKSIECSETV
jgi:hypothetical protein